MMNFLLLFIILSPVYSSESIYGKDNRFEVEDLPEYKNLSKNVPSIIPSKYLQQENNIFTIKPKEISSSSIPFCPEVRFSHQPSLSLCTGVLISKNRVLTAAHCMNKPDSCSDNYFVFGWSVKDGLVPKEIPAGNVYRCEKILTQQFFGETGSVGIIDYAIIELDRDVVDHEPADIDIVSNIQLGTKAFSIGTTSGWPLKISLDATILKNTHNIIQTDLDISSGNSGGPVYSDKNKKVIGIIHAGPYDPFFNLDSKRACLEEVPYPQPKLNTRNVSLVGNVTAIKISSIPELSWPEKDWESSKFLEKNDYKGLKKSIESGTTPNIRNLQTGDTALMQVMKDDLKDEIDFLISKGADASQRSNSGQNALELAYELNNLELLKRFTKLKADLSSLMMLAIKKSDPSLVRIVLEANFNPVQVCPYLKLGMSYVGLAKEVNYQKKTPSSEAVLDLILAYNSLK